MRRAAMRPDNNSYRVLTGLGVDEAIEIRFEIEDDAVGGVWQRNSSDEQNHEHDVRKQRRHVHHLANSVKTNRAINSPVFQHLPEPNRTCLVGVYAVMLDPPTFLIWNNLCDLVYQTLTKSYQSQIPVAFGIPGHVTTKRLPDTPC